MEHLELPFEFKEIQLTNLLIEKAIQFAQAISRGPYVKFIDCKQSENNDEVIYFDIEPEIGQLPTNDIQYQERLAVLFYKLDEKSPEVYALRKDFPFVMHLNAMNFEVPRCLCIYETSYDERRILWRANAFLEDIRTWLERTAQGDIHLDDQPLEPFLLGTLGNLILPPTLIKEKQLFVHGEIVQEKWFNLIATYSSPGKQETHTQYQCISITTSPQLHGYLKKSPTNLSELDELLKELGLDFTEGKLKSWLRGLALTNQSPIKDQKLVILLHVPKKRTLEGPVEATDCIAFLVFATVLEIAIATNTYAEHEKLIALVFPYESSEKKKTDKITSLPLRTYNQLNKLAAKKYSGIDSQVEDPLIGLIGVGALGSQVLETLSRMGFGTWKIIDKDWLLPHNLVRHALTQEYTSYSKSLAVAYKVNNLLSDSQHCQQLHEDYYNPGKPEVLYNHFNDVDIILDISASVAVARKLSADTKIACRRASLFCNPSGKDLVFLGEPLDRSIQLDHLEMQYYRIIWKMAGLNNHLMVNGKPLRYSAACRDITSAIKQENMVVLAGTGARAIRKYVTNKNGEIAVWQMKGSGAIEHYSFAPYAVKEKKVGNWTVCIDEHLKAKIVKARLEKLPNETGGVLIGTYDQVLKKLYVVDTILSPKDSLEHPNAYYRGIEGLEPKLKALGIFTGYNLQYIGEWHSHPNNCSVNQSEDDKKLFSWIKEHMHDLSLPGLMLIAGDNDQLGIYVD